MRGALHPAVLTLLLAVIAQPAVLAQDGNIDDPGAIGSDVTIKLSNGDTLSGRLLKNTGVDVVIEHPLLGTITIMRTLIDLEDPEVAPPVPEVIEVVSPWSGSIDFSIEGSTGNVEEVKYYATLNVRHETERVIDSLYATFAKERNSQTPTGRSQATKDEQYARLRREWKLANSKWLPFAQIGSQWDSFKGYDYRINGAAGAGYPLIDQPDERFVGRLGLGANRKVGAEVEDDWVIEGLVGADYRTDFSPTTHFVVETTVWPALTNSFGDFRTFSVGEWRLDISETSPWYFKIGADHEYDSNPDEGNDSADLNYYAGIGATF